MIYTKKKNLSRYLGQSKSLDAAIRAILHSDPEQLSMGRNDIDGDNAFVNRFDYDTVPQEQALWEGHIAYGDVHVLLGGHEKIGVSNVERLTETVRKLSLIHISEPEGAGGLCRLPGPRGDLVHHDPGGRADRLSRGYPYGQGGRRGHRPCAEVLL